MEEELRIEGDTTWATYTALSVLVRDFPFLQHISLIRPLPSPNDVYMFEFGGGWVYGYFAEFDTMHLLGRLTVKIDRRNPFSEVDPQTGRPM